MGRNLHYTIPQFLQNALNNHSKVESWQRIDNFKKDNDFIYLVNRVNGFDNLIIHASDEYAYSLTDYFQRPEQIQSGSFILLARPEATYDDSIVELAANDQISIGKFGALMGALHIEQHWNYTPKERRQEN